MGAELGRLVTQRRHEAGLSRRDVAERSGVGYSYLSQIENGDREPALKTMRALAGVLNLPVERMAGLADSAQRVSSPVPASAYDEPVELWRDKVLPSVERRLAAVPPLERLQLLHELTAQALAELRRT